jgi:DNA helicase-2/ATP-dependent DNA helicase PcrA
MKKRNIPYVISHKDALNENEAHGVKIMTIHGSKGLEFQTVILPRLNEGSLPYRKDTLDYQIEEERRLFYVAMTRAKENLFITYIKKNKGKDVKPSRFLKELFL